MPSPAPHRGTPPSGRPRRERLALAAVVLAPLVAYLPYLGKGFVSEDFLLIALHREHPPWSDLAATFGGPWLGMRLFEFYRPLAALLFGAESVLFGASSTGYNVVHVAMHLLATWLVLVVLRTLLRDAGGDDAPGAASVQIPAACGALFFGLYPLAPNSVLFAASFANLFGATATLGAACLYLRWRRDREQHAGLARSLRSRLPLGALLVYAVAIGCYESSTLLPLWLGLLELARPRPTRRAVLASALALFPFFALALGYALFRATLFGEPIGGYAEMATSLRTPDPGMAWLALRTLLRLPAPWFEAAPAPALEALAAIAVYGLAAIWVTAARSPARSGLARLLILGVGWVLVFVAPFSFQLVSPGNGRYWYLSAAGAAMVLAALAARVGVVANPRRRRWLAGCAALALAVLLARNVALLRQHLGWLEEAAITAERIADEIERVAPPGPFFVADHPAFVRSARGTHRAQVYHYGLRAAVGPPFRDRQADVYPLPPRTDADPRRLALDHPVFRWLPAERRLVPIRPRRTALPPLLEVAGPPEGAELSPEQPGALQVAVAAPGAPAVFRVVTVAPGNPRVTTTAVEAGPPALELPGAFVRFWSTLAPGPLLWWVEHLDAAGQAVAASRPRWLRVAPETAPQRKRSGSG